MEGMEGDPSVSLFPGILQRSKATPSCGISSLSGRRSEASGKVRDPRDPRDPSEPPRRDAAFDAWEKIQLDTVCLD